MNGWNNVGVMAGQLQGAEVTTEVREAELLEQVLNIGAKAGLYGIEKVERKVGAGNLPSISENRLTLS